MNLDINKYIENTKRKTAKTKLPALSTLSPVMPDGAAGIATFNSSFGEDLNSNDIDTVKSVVEVESETFMIEKGFEESELDDVLNIEYIENDNVLTINIFADLTISSLRELADSLYEIVSKYDESAYFDISANNSISVELTIRDSLVEDKEMHSMDVISEKLHTLDRVGFDLYCEDYDFEALYESVKTTLSPEDKSRLSQFLQTTDDPEEVNVYMKGLLMEDADDEMSTSPINEQILDEINSAYRTLHDTLNHLVGEANRSGDDMLRASADLALGALDEFYSYIEDIKDDFADYQVGEKRKTYPPVETYVKRFNDVYPDKEEFESSTDMTYNEQNITEVIYDWVLSDIEDGTQQTEDYAYELAMEAAEKIIKG